MLDCVGSSERGHVTRATVCALISPYLAYWLYLGQPRIAIKMLGIGIALCTGVIFGIIGLELFLNGGLDLGKVSIYADIAGIIVIESWDLYLLRDVRKRIR